MYKHGGDIYSNKVKKDFSVSLNPLGMPESVKKAISEHIEDYETYPDYSCRELRKDISRHENVDAENIICGNGAAELIYDVVRAVSPKRALIFVPAFSEYEKALRAVDCQVDYFFLKDKQGFTLKGEKDMEELRMRLTERYDMVFLCNPNNPAGSILKEDIIIEILRKCALYNTIVVLDECFIEFTDEASFAMQTSQFENLFLIKAFTKIYSMAGVRLGYGICSGQKLLERIQSVRQCWNVSAIAQEAGRAALLEKDYAGKTRRFVKNERIYLENELIKCGFNVAEGVGNYILFQNPADEEDDLYEKLLEKQILIRKCDDYKGLGKGYFRIAVKSHEDNEILIRAICEIKHII